MHYLQKKRPSPAKADCVSASGKARPFAPTVQADLDPLFASHGTTVVYCGSVQDQRILTVATDVVWPIRAFASDIYRFGFISKCNSTKSGFLSQGQSEVVWF